MDCVSDRQTDNIINIETVISLLTLTLFKA